MNAVTRSESSPRRVRIATPSTPTRSPRSRPTSRSKPSSPSSSTRACSWIRPERSTRSRNAARPPSRRAAMRPATRCATAVSSPAASASCAASTAAIGSTPSNAYGNGLDALRAQPLELRPPRREQLRQLAGRPRSWRRRLPPHDTAAGQRDRRRRRPPPEHSARPSGPPAAQRRARRRWVEPRAPSLHADVDLRDLQLARRAARNLHRDDLVAAVAEQRPADGRLVRELVLGGLGLGRADDRVARRLAGLLVLDVDDRADRDDVGRERPRPRSRSPSAASPRRSRSAPRASPARSWRRRTRRSRRCRRTRGPP